MYGAPVPRNTLRTLARLFFGGMTALAAVLPSGRAAASFTVVPPPEVTEATAAYKYANMTDVEAYAELDKRKVPYKKADPIPGVMAPVRLTGKLHGVWIHSSIPESQRATSVYEVLDARLALAVDDFAKILERHDIEEVVHYSLYRPNVPREDHDVKEPRTPALPAAKLDVPEAKATAPLAKAPLAKAPLANPHLADAKSAPIAGKPALPGKPQGPASAPVSKPGTAPLAKSSKPVPAKSPALPPKPQGAKSQLPQLPNKALPQLPAKSTAPVHGAKHKAPVAIDKPALPKPSTKSAASPASPATATHPATAAHPKTTAAKAGPPARARGASGTAVPPVAARATTPAKATTPAAPQKGTKPVVVAKASTPATAPVSAKAPAAPASAPRAPVSRQTWASPGTRHPAGLAIDVALLKKRDGQWISVANDFHGKIGAKTCGDGVRSADTPEARELRSLVCESNDLGVFTYVLTPNYNAAHYDHFHMEIRPATRWILFH